MMPKSPRTEELTNQTKEGEKLFCGIIMPISAIDGCTPDHWKEVLGILKDTIIDANFQPRLVSDSDDSGIIQSRIIQNVYNDPIIVCDVSCENPNVMFELGMRLAFDKPTIIIKDDKTDYTFDTSIIEHLSYPRDLRFNSIVTFKKLLKEKISATYKNSVDNKDYTTFLKHFGNFKVSTLEEKSISQEEYLIKSIEDLRSEVRRIRINVRNPHDDNDDSSRIRIITLRQIENKIDSFLLERGLPNFDLNSLPPSLYSELINYLESDPSITLAVGSANNLKKYLSTIAGKNNT